ncbi:MAG: radical SAM protein [Tannerella sp.]|jgi:uncharacterized protein|nr:radical SAM protein [Tannerella sp.]
MKSSCYNFFLSQKEHIICFNAFSLNFFYILPEKEKTVKDILDNPDIYKDKIPVFYKKLKDGNFVVDDDVYEPDLVLQKYNERVHNKHYKLVILPTLQCNFRCWYCIQRHVLGKMDGDMLHRIYRHIEYMIVKEGIESLDIEWFGGEPFLYFSEIIKPVSDYAKEFCGKYNIPFSSSATTNGFLITPEVVKQLQEYNFKGFQITLDGDREHHNQTRKSKKASSFDVILNNINCICTQLDCSITLRINYDDKNLNPEKIIAQVNEIISPNLRDKIRFIFRKVWQVDFVHEERQKLTAATSIIQKTGYTGNSDLIKDFVPCYASRKYYNTISFDGKVHKCTAKDNLHKDSLGHLDENGIIQWHVKDFETVYYKPLFENEKCLQCKYLPICMGPCPKRLENNGLKTPDFICHRGKINGFEFEDSMLNYCRSVK